MQAQAQVSGEDPIAQLQAEVAELRERLDSVEAACVMGSRGVAPVRTPMRAGRQFSPAPSQVTSFSKDPMHKEDNKIIMENSVAAMSTATEEDPTVEEYSYSLNQSVWDAVLLIFMPKSPLSHTDSFVLAGLFLINAAVQVLFSFVVAFQAVQLQNELTGEDFQQDALAWRIGAGHHINNWDPVTHTSLVTRVCSNYGAEIISTWQQDVYQGIKTYMDGGEEGGHGLGLSHGPAVCVLAVFMWTVEIFRELMQTFNFTVAVLAAERGRTHLHRSITIDGEKVYELRSLNWTRRAVVLILSAVVRLLIAVCLWFAGTFWLTYTVELNDIITNVVALGFVLQFDELLFEMAPGRMGIVLSRMVPLRASLARRPRRWHTDIKPVVIFALVFLTVGIWGEVSLKQFHKELRIAENLFCGGDTSFTYSEDPALRVVTVAPTLTESAFRQNFSVQGSRPDIFRAVLQRTKLLDTVQVSDSILGSYTFTWVNAEEDVFLEKEGVNEILELNTQPRDYAVDQIPCSDLDKSPAVRFAMLSSLGADSCAVLAEEVGCSNMDVRIYCAATCQCGSATSGIYSRGGCTEQCDSQVREHGRRLLEQLLSRGEACQDLVDVGHADWYLTFFHEYQRQLLSRGYLRSNSTGTFFTEAFRESMSLRTDRLWKVNPTIDVSLTSWFQASVAAGWECRFALYFDHLFSTDVCAEGLAEGRGSIASFCPRLCGACGGATDAAPQQEWHILARDFRAIGAEVLSSHMAEALAHAEDLSICKRKGDSMLVVNGSTAGAADLLGQPAAGERLFTVTAQSTGAYVLAVRAAPEFDAYLSIWDGNTFERKYENDNALGSDPCAKVEVQAGERLIVVIEGVGSNESGDFELTVRCPWHLEDADKRCPLNPTLHGQAEQRQVGQFSLQMAKCETLGLYPVFGDGCLEAASQLRLRVGASSAWAGRAPVGCSYDDAGQTLFVDGVGNGECGDVFSCICSSVPQDVLFSKTCVEIVDPLCRNGTWDDACKDLCTNLCGKVCQLTPFVMDGPCGLSVNQTAAGEEWCMTSPNFPRDYGQGQRCVISQDPDQRVRFTPFASDYFYVDYFGEDSLTVNGVSFGGERPPRGVIPVPSFQIVWSSDGLDASGPIDSGWKICTTVSRATCVDSTNGAVNSLGQDCAYLAANSLFCDESYDTASFSVREMCCHCGGGTEDIACPLVLPAQTALDECHEGLWPAVKDGTTCGDCKAVIDGKDGFRSMFGTCANYCGFLGRTCRGAFLSADGGCSVQGEVSCEELVEASAAICECGGDIAPVVEGKGCNEENWPDRYNGEICGDCKVVVERFNTFYKTCNSYCASVGRTCVGAWEEGYFTCDPYYEVGCDAEHDSFEAMCECSKEQTMNFTDQCNEHAWPHKRYGVNCGDCRVYVADISGVGFGTCGAYCASLGRSCVASGSPKEASCEVFREKTCDTEMALDAICECGVEVDPGQQDLCDEETWPSKAYGYICGDCKVLVGHMRAEYTTCSDYCGTMRRRCVAAWQDLDYNCEVDHEMACDEVVEYTTAICECSPEQVLGAAETMVDVNVGSSPALNTKCVSCIDSTDLSCNATAEAVGYTFDVTTRGGQVCATRTDIATGWDINLAVQCQPVQRE